VFQKRSSDKLIATGSIITNVLALRKKTDVGFDVLDFDIS